MAFYDGLHMSNDAGCNVRLRTICKLKINKKSFSTWLDRIRILSQQDVAGTDIAM